MVVCHSSCRKQTQTSRIRICTLHYSGRRLCASWKGPGGKTKSLKWEILTGPPRSARLMPSQGKTSLQHPSSRLRFCPEDRVAWAGSSLTLAPFATSWPLSQDHNGSAVTQHQWPQGCWGERSLREPQAKLLNLLWQDLSTKFWGRAEAYLQSKLWGHSGHTDAPPSTCASPHLPPWQSSTLSLQTRSPHLLLQQVS